MCPPQGRRVFPFMPAQFASSNCTIFVIDADPSCRTRIATLMDRLNFRTVCLASAEEFLQELDDAPGLSCVISEMELPGMSGLELSETLHERAPHLPVIILTGHQDVSMAVLAMRRNVSDYLIKPFVERDLVNRVRNVLSAPRVRI